MAAFDASAWIGARQIRPTEAQLTQIANYDPGLYKVGMDALWRHVHYFVLTLLVATSANATTKYSLEMTARVPFKVVAAEVGVESAGGSACTMDLEKNPSGDPDTYATMSTGAVAVKAAAGSFVNLPILEDSEDVAAGDQLRVAVVGTDAGDVVGAVAQLHCFRL